ncbi:amidohydrolase family protein [Adhaeribacter radiodurans]|uniref:Amidohydrolase family protein n=1 Tax=Adhaeribacter radiodurans TaxID=2745197 RepID=A0A7L7LB58_9BACT|nr:amidohydrolase family protein [Adhaeribacter radiodurans]QMU29639.1 amidohydrolase family protein [Adhaeribacter radiodurans]
MKILAFLLLLFTSVLPVFAQKQSTSYLIKAGKFYDAEKNQFLTDQEILISGSTIQAVGTRLKTPKNTQILDARNATVVPGLIDAHTHLLFKQKQTDGMEVGSKIPAAERLEEGQQFAEELLQVGFTTLRDLGNSGPYLDLQLQNNLQQAKTPAPRLYVSGPIISPPGGQFSKLAPADTFVIKQEYRVIKGSEQAKQAVQEHAAKGVNVIKVCMDCEGRYLNAAEIKAIVETAREKKLPVTAHAGSDKGARLAVLAGVNGIEHGYSLSDSTLSIMAQRKVYLVPTDVSREKAMLMVTGMGMKGKEAEDNANSFLNATHDRLKRARQKGVIIVAGSDFYNDMPTVTRGDGSRDVIIAYYEAGLSSANVLQTATINAATVMGIHNLVGTIKKGMKADIAIFNGDLEKAFPQSIVDLKMVLKDGQVISTKKAR